MAKEYPFNSDGRQQGAMAPGRNAVSGNENNGGVPPSPSAGNPSFQQQHQQQQNPTMMNGMNGIDPNALLTAAALGMLVSYLPGGNALAAAGLAHALHSVAAQQQEQQQPTTSLQPPPPPPQQQQQTFSPQQQLPTNFASTSNSWRTSMPEVPVQVPAAASTWRPSVPTPAAPGTTDTASSHGQQDLLTQNQATSNVARLPSSTSSSLLDCALAVTAEALYPPGPTSIGRVIYLDQDEQELSPYQCLVRKQIEVFELPETLNGDDKDSGETCQGRNRPVVPRQVGIRCRHCGPCHPNFRTRGSILFPSTLLGVYQTAQNMANTHLIKKCKLIPPSTREKLLQVRTREEGKKTRKSAYGGGRKYWADALAVLGVVDTPEKRLRFADPMKKRAARPDEKKQTSDKNDTKVADKSQTEDEESEDIKYVSSTESKNSFADNNFTAV